MRNKTIIEDLMPDSEEDKRILRERMEQLSKQTTEKVKSEDGNTYVRFKLGKNELYGIPYQFIKEVINIASLTKIPCVNSFIAGMINRRGALLVILDLKDFLNFTDKSYDTKPNIIVIKASGFTLGLLADSIEGSFMYDAAVLEPPLSFVSAIKAEYILGLHNGVVAILNVETILNDLAVLIKQPPPGQELIL